ncbi:putative RNA methyltransferase [Arthrobacter mangrovi]|uniref:SAM-dependent methyltransferase n=1 Tax=Arthrobacter mangrovi TaxID=2966350 RepID=A0ABQ5MTL6_9MICC|nr:methyltransferase domain-containing protein [Arthrobacter mangrovi]GLB67332.1 SAM-dependent methyltransferase [Arthrobacter mangrovi]
MPPLPEPLDAVALLRCPVCSAAMAAASDTAAGGLRCTAGHAFDGARQGYVNLLTGKGTSFIPDTADMVAARAAFLDAGHYRPLMEAVRAAAAQLLAGTAEPVVVDAGAGTGHYLAPVLASLPQCRAVALDLSKYALRRAARTCPQALCVVWDLWRPLPLADGAADLVLNIFAPRNPEEYARILRPGGRLLVVTPAPGHLEALRRIVPLLAIDTDKAERLAASLGSSFEPEGAEELVVPLELDPEDLRNLVMMGPNAHHVDPAALDKAAEAPRSGVEARFTISIFGKRH